MTNRRHLGQLELASAPRENIVLRGAPHSTSTQVIGTPDRRSDAAQGIGTASSSLSTLGSTPEQKVEEARALAETRGYEEGFARGVLEAQARASADAEAESRKAATASKQLLLDTQQEVRTAVSKEVRLEAAAMLLRFQSLLESLPPQMDAMLEASEEEMVTLCVEVLVRFLGQELVNPSSIAGWIRAAIREQGTKTLVAIHLHPQDLQALRQAPGILEELEGHLASTAADSAESRNAAGMAHRLRWVPDASVSTGGCVLIGAEGALDARINTRLSMLSAILLKARANAASGPASS